MNEVIELALESPDGIIDCRLEPEENEEGVYYAATILYPVMVNGHSRSDIFCANLVRHANTGGYTFDEGEDIHPKIKRLEAKLSAAVVAAYKKS